ncbi:MAG TPA: NAD+ synthase [Candidatus Limnocylindrales bacterium]|nr:NAD+ synthase [Candidatus Limnocylindrales bacterium]
MADDSQTAAPSPRGVPWELPEELLIDTSMARRIIVRFIRSHMDQTGFDRAVLGLSGGIDSALVAYLAAEAIGPANLLCLLMPYRTSSPASRVDAEAVVAELGCAAKVIEITPLVDGYFDRALASSDKPSHLRLGNFAARARMAVLFDHSAAWNGLVLGTSNKTESLLGYTTIFGDNAAALQPIGDLFKSQVRQLSVAVGVPDAILRKAPTADLWAGQTDEQEVGLSYAEIDRILHWLVDRRRGRDGLRAMGFEPANIVRVERLIAGSEFKRQMAPVAKLSLRTPGVDYLYPRRRPGPSG